MEEKKKAAKRNTKQRQPGRAEKAGRTEKKATDRGAKTGRRDAKASGRTIKAGRQDTGKVCPYAKKCGGCQMIGLPYEKQLQKKKARVAALLKPYGTVEKITGMEDPKYYRNKVHAVYARTRAGEILAGTYEQGSHRVVNVDRCYLDTLTSDAIIATTRLLACSFKIPIYDEDRQTGLLRHVLVRTAHATGQVMVVLVTASPVFPSRNHFVKALRKEHPEITTVIQNINGKSTSMVLGTRSETLFGPGYITDELCGRRFRLSPTAFYQINPIQTEKLYAKAIEYAQLTGRETVIDAYCGIGTIGIIASDRAAKVIGAELNAEAVKDAVYNAKLNQVSNIRFVAADAGKFMVEMTKDGSEKIDVVLMDPPRSGSSEEFLRCVITAAPERIVYVSCGPDSLARDLKYLTAHGYRMEHAECFDLFPHTEHTESIALLERVSNRKADSYVKLNVKMEDYYRIKDAEGGEVDG